MNSRNQYEIIEFCKISHFITVLIITASHQTIFGQFWCLSGQNKFDLTHLLYIINGKVSVFLVDKVMSGQIFNPYYKHCISRSVWLKSVSNALKLLKQCSTLAKQSGKSNISIYSKLLKLQASP